MSRTQVQRPQSNLDFEHAYHQYNRVQNDDPINEYMYQMPIVADNGRTVGRERGDGDGDAYATTQSQALDLRALNQRLQVLGLSPHISNESLLEQQPHPAALGSAFKTNPITPLRPFSPPETSRSYTQPPQEGYQPFYPPFEYQSQSQQHSAQGQVFSPPLKPPTAVDLHPSDSLSQMYRPYRGPVESVRSQRRTQRGGTNVDGQDVDDYEHNSSWETRHAPPSDAPSLEEMTMGRTEWANDTMGGDMLDMRDRLIHNKQAQEAHEAAAINAHIADASTLAAALTKLEVTQDQLRTLQATLIAERVARTQMERRSHEGEDDVRDVKNELAGAVRALRRAREEAKRNEEEKRRLAKCFEETKVQLYKYHEELRVRDARSKGREEGRAEAWQEAERWMGQAPPIPIDPIHSVPQAVFRQTPMTAPTGLPQGQAHAGGQDGQAPFQQHPGDNFMIPHVQSPPSMLQQSHGQPHTQQSQPSQHVEQQQYQPPPPSTYTQPQPAGQQGIPMMMPPAPAPGGMMQQTVYQPMMVPIAVPQPHTQQQQPIPTFPAQPPHSQNIPRSAPHRLNQLPPHSQANSHSHAHPPRAATVISRTPQNPYPPRLPLGSHQRSVTIGSASLHPPAPGSMPPQHQAAESYLDRADHDPHVQQMLHDTHSKTIHTSASSDRPQTARSVLAPVDKPLPTPGGGHANVGRSQTHTTRPSRAGTMASGKPKPQRYSLLEELHGHKRNESTLHGEDRYPAFPHQKQQHLRDHSRNNSFDSINPAGIALPHSTAGSLMNTPRSRATSRRSKVAGALRGGTEIEDLSDIAEDEREREARRSFQANQQQQAQQHQQQQNMAYQQAQSDRAGPAPQQRPHPKQNYAPSMPPMRGRPTPRMPQQLGAGDKAPSEPHIQPLHAKHGLANFFHRHTHHQDQAQADDRQAAMFARMPDVDRSTKPKGAHDLYVPPGMAPLAVHGSVMDIQGPRTSALGLEGLGDQAEHRHHGSAGTGTGVRGRSRSGTMESGKAPTINIQPPSSQNKSRPDTNIPSPSSRALQPKTPTQTRSNIPRAPVKRIDAHSPTKRQTTIITEYYEPHATPLPASRPHAPTAYSGFSPDRVLSPPDMSSGDNMPSISVIDYALRQALPGSRPTTIMSVMPPRVTVASEPDIDEPSRKPTTPAGKQQKRKPTLTIYGHNTGHVDPRQVPLPASRAPTHRPGTSTYAGTVATIDEVTEEESAKENRRPRR